MLSTDHISRATEALVNGAKTPELLDDLLPLVVEAKHAMRTFYTLWHACRLDDIIAKSDAAPGAASAFEFCIGIVEERLAQMEEMMEAASEAAVAKPCADEQP